MEKIPALPPEQVMEFVANAHGDLARVRELLAATPGLVNAAWDWGGGDFETGLGAAAHTGQRAIALFLLENGARLDLPAAVTLGRLEFVRAAVAAFPGCQRVPGAHRIPLIRHAEMGGPEAAEVLEYLQSLP